MTEILLIRHGETDWNVEKRLQGHRDIGLNAEGRRQAAALGQVLLDEPIDAIFASDLQRARDTAQAIAIPRGMTLQIEPGLRERCYGGFEGLLHGEIEACFPEDFIAWKARDLDVRYPRATYQAETLREFAARVMACLTRVAGHAGYRKIAVVTHGGVLDTLHRQVNSIGYEHPRSFEVLNASINRLRWDGENFHIVTWAEVGHLAHAALDEVDSAK